MKINNSSIKLRSLPIINHISLRSSFKKYYHQFGFSLTEIMVVVAIIGVLTSIAVPQYAKYQRKARQTEAKLMLSGIYTSNMSFNAEWGYSTPNLYQMGFSPSGDILYNVGFNSTSESAAKKINKIAEADRPSDYDGPPPPQEDLTNTKTLCIDPTYGSGCTFLSTPLDTTIPSGSNVTKIDNSDKYSPKFIIIAVGHLGGGNRDEWKYEVSDSIKTMTNEKNGL